MVYKTDKTNYVHPILGKLHKIKNEIFELL